MEGYPIDLNEIPDDSLVVQTTVASKRCTRCGHEKDINQFTKGQKGKYGHRCISCREIVKSGMKKLSPIKKNNTFKSESILQTRCIVQTSQINTNVLDDILRTQVTSIIHSIMNSDQINDRKFIVEIETNFPKLLLDKLIEEKFDIIESCYDGRKLTFTAKW